MTDQIMSTGNDQSLAALVRRLRTDLGESQLGFAARFNVSRSLIANIETGVPPSQAFVSALVAAFPEQEASIVAAYGRLDDARTPGSQRKPQSVFQHRVGIQVESGRLLEAEAALRHELATGTSGTDPIWITERLAGVLFALGRSDQGLTILADAVAALRPDRSRQAADKLATLQNELASRYQRRDDFDAAHKVLDQGLVDQPDAAILWHRKGIVHWYAHSYSEAYASLTTALKHGHPIRRIVHARGQVLAEWGSYQAAIRDLTAAIDDPQVTPGAAAYAQSTRAHVYAKLGNWDYAREQWALAETITPDNAWLHYFRALCYIDRQEYELAVNGFRRALQANSPGLNLPKRLRAAEAIDEYKGAEPRNKPG